MLNKNSTNNRNKKQITVCMICWGLAASVTLPAINSCYFHRPKSKTNSKSGAQSPLPAATIFAFGSNKMKMTCFSYKINCINYKINISS